MGEQSSRIMFVLAIVGVCMLSGASGTGWSNTTDKPNIVLIFADDLGYGDLGCYGASPSDTPRLDRMAAEGTRFTNFYVAQAVCGASRAALLSGCYPNRLSLFGAPNHTATHGIHAEEMILPEVLKQRGYVTGMVGKWHLGHLPEFLPTRHGFDQYIGLPYSNDMWPHHPEGGGYPPLPLLQGEAVVDAEVTAEDQSRLTTMYTEYAVQFLRAQRDQPFFLYLAHTMPHVPLHVSPARRGSSGRGLYGDVLAEIDWSVGQILDTLKECQLDAQTLVVFTSDNGPWLSYGNHAGSAGGLREGKGTTWEGGVRVPCIIRWPGQVAAGQTCDEMAATMDLLPTFAQLAQAPLPPREIDGRSIWSLLVGTPDARSPHEAYYFYWGEELQAVRCGKWKLHFPHPYRTLSGAAGSDGKPGLYRELRCDLELYDLQADAAETCNVAEKYPEIVELLSRFADGMRAELGDSLRGRKGTAVRPAGKSRR